MKLVPNTLSRNMGRTVLKAKKNSPHLFFGAGVVGVLGSTVLACRATLKLEKAVDEIKTDFNAVTDMAGYNELGSNGESVQKYTNAQYRRDVGYVYLKGAGKLSKLYAPAILVGGVSIAALTGSHIQLTKRNAALTATLAAVMKAYDEYRIRVQEEIGEERERELYRDIQEEKDKAGKIESVKSVNPSKYSIYAKCFDEYNSNWKQSSEINRNFLQCQQEYANNQLHARGHVLLNDVYDSLGIERTVAGAVVGWVRKGNGDGYIDFGIFEAMNSKFINNLEPSIWLDFNVDGVVYDLIEEA